MKKNESNLINKKKYVVLLVVVFCLGLLVSVGTYALWGWSSTINKDVVFNMADGFEKYITYNVGNSHFVGNFQTESFFCDSVNTTLSFFRTVEPDDVDFYANIKIDVNSIGSNISNSNDVYWVLTTGDATIECNDGVSSSNVVSYGTFKDVENGETIDLKKNINVTTEEQIFTVWIWIDSLGDNLSSLSGETIDVNVWTEFTMTKYSEFDDHSLMITSYTCNDENGNPVTVGNNPYFTYTGQCEVIDDGDGDWRIRFLTDGEFTSNLNIPIDAFLVGGGGGGAYGGGGGGGGYVSNTFANVESGTKYSITIGAGGEGATSTVNGGAKGGDTLAFNSIAYGGAGSTGYEGGSGGSGGGAGSSNEYSTAGTGGTNGSNGRASQSSGGSGQGISTYEFGDSTLVLYAGGGGGGGACSDERCSAVGAGGEGGGGAGTTNSVGISASHNTGGGGGGGSWGGGAGGSGVVVIRNTRISSEDVIRLPSVAFDFTYTGGYYSIVNEGNGNWKIKFLTDGEFVSNTDLQIDAFLVGGGGGGYYEGGGGGGGYVSNTFANVESGTKYSITIGAGGEGATSTVNGGAKGGDTLAFNSIAYGGAGSTGYGGGSGGSGGGGGSSNSTSIAGAGGINGFNGGASQSSGGSGQGITTYEFGDSTLVLYAGGGGGSGSYDDYGSQKGGEGGLGGGAAGSVFSVGISASHNTGGGGGGGNWGGGAGGSGVVVIRNTRISSEDVKHLPSVDFDFTYTGGYYSIVNEGNGNWKIKFLTDGEFVSNTDLEIDAFLVGGGGGGYYGGGGGGGGYVSNTFANVESGTKYSITIGAGGKGAISYTNGATKGGDTIAFNSIAYGGAESVGYEGGAGGSGGGGGSSNSTSIAGEGGSNGSNGGASSFSGGSGQGITTYEFGDSTLVLYAGGGGGSGSADDNGGQKGGAGGLGGGADGSVFSVGISASHNTGGGGGGGSWGGGSGGSGIVIIRNKR